MHAALPVDGPADPRTVAGQDQPKVRELRGGAVALYQLGDALLAVEGEHECEGKGQCKPYRGQQQSMEDQGPDAVK